MRPQVYLLAALAALSFATAPGAQTPVRQPATSPSPSQPTQSNTQTQTDAQQTVRPPDTRTPTTTTNNPASQRSRIPPASRGVGTTGSKPNCSNLRGLEKAECERRDTVRDDLPAGVTSTQPKDPKSNPKSK